jgi:copper chaperone NosL
VSDLGASGKLLALATLLAACGERPPAPARLDTANESCRFCRMAISDQRTAAQLVAPGEEPLFFDDVACLRDFLASGPRIRPGAIVYVADHVTGSWVFADGAVYTRALAVATPMDSHLLAHSSAEARAADPAAAGGVPLSAAAVFGAALPPRGEAGGR